MKDCPNPACTVGCSNPTAQDCADCEYYGQPCVRCETCRNADTTSRLDIFHPDIDRDG